MSSMIAKTYTFVRPKDGANEHGSKLESTRLTLSELST